MESRRFRFLLLCLLTPTFAVAAPYYGATFSYPVVAKEPPSLHGFQVMLNYDPQRFQWRKFNVYFDGGFSHFSASSQHASSLNIYSIAPVVRYTFRRRGPILPYLELSIGFAYLNATRFEKRNLGIHFAFQDRLGIGAFIGQSSHFSIGFHAVHYSNAHLSSHNSGVTIPVVLDIGYRFS